METNKKALLPMKYYHNGEIFLFENKSIVFNGIATILDILESKTESEND